LLELGNGVLCSDARQVLKLLESIVASYACKAGAVAIGGALGGPAGSAVGIAVTANFCKIANGFLVNKLIDNEAQSFCRSFALGQLLVNAGVDGYPQDLLAVIDVDQNAPTMPYFGSPDFDADITFTR
jgi:hypothetical protein